MLVYTESGGYGNIDLKEVKDIIDKYLPVRSKAKMILLLLLNDYECLQRVIQGKDCIYRHSDGSETRRLKLY